MTLQFGCMCGAKLKARPEASGKTLKCPKCGARVLVPASSEASPGERTFRLADPQPVDTSSVPKKPAAALSTAKPSRRAARVSFPGAEAAPDHSPAPDRRAAGFEAWLVVRLLWGYVPLLLAGVSFGGAIAVWVLRPSMSSDIAGVAVPAEYASYYPATLPIPPNASDILMAPGTKEITLRAQYRPGRVSVMDPDSEWTKSYIPSTPLAWEGERKSNETNRITIKPVGLQKPGALVPYAAFDAYADPDLAQSGSDRRRQVASQPAPMPATKGRGHVSIRAYLGHADLRVNSIFELHSNLVFHVGNNQLATTMRCHVVPEELVKRRAYDIENAKAPAWELMILGMLVGLVFAASAASEHLLRARWPSYHAAYYQPMAESAQPRVSIGGAVFALGCFVLLFALLFYVAGYVVWALDEHVSPLWGLLYGRREAPEFLFLKETLTREELETGLGRDLHVDGDLIRGYPKDAPPVRTLKFCKQSYLAQPYLHGYLWHCTEVREVTVWDCADDELLRYCAPMNKMETLKIFGLQADSPSITDASIAYIGKLDQLRELVITRSKLGDDFVQGLPRLTKLEVLVLDHCVVTDASIEHLAKLPGLRELKITSPKITQEGIDKLKSFSNVTHLHVANDKDRYSRVPPIETPPLGGGRRTGPPRW